MSSTASFTPEYVPLLRRPRKPAEAQRLYNHIRTVAIYLDALTSVSPSMKDFPIQVGIEPIIAAALPVIGPFIGLGLGLYVVLLSFLFFQVPIESAGWMIINLLIDTFSGLIPVIGTVVDVTFKANLANLAILEKHIRKTKWAMIIIPQPSRWFNWGNGPSGLFSGR